MTSSLICRRIQRPGLVMVILAATALAPPVAHAAETRTPAAAKPVPLMSAEAFRRQQDWRAAIIAAPKPKKGCFTAKFPSTEWQEVPCVSTPDYPMPPRGGIVPQTVGAGDDVAAQAPAGAIISSTTGSFDSLTNVTSESGQIGGAGPNIANAYTLQINPNPFPTSACSGSPNKDCLGWQQFLFENNNASHRAFIQYWLINFDMTCPAGFKQIDQPPHISCVIKANSSGAVGTPPVPVTNLGQVTLTGTANASGDSIVVTVGGTAFARNGDNAVNASSGWSISEFNVVGDGGNSAGVSSTAVFNAGAALVTRTQISYGGHSPPMCVANGFTAEKNNLSFGPGAPAASSGGPALIFNESTAGGSPSACAASTAVGDTHLTTLSGLLYDFQASGDFELLQTGSGFTVQNRQVNGAPNWPNAAVSSAVAASFGKTQVAVCIKPQSVYVNGRRTQVLDGKSLALDDGTQITRTGSTYFIRGAGGDWLRAVVNVGSGTDYIDTSLGLGRWPVEAHGLLSNARDDPNRIATRDGKVLTNPFSFDALYHLYADSWRISPADSMLNVCGERAVAGIPKKPFTSRDLAPGVAQKVAATCHRAGIKDAALLEACKIDVAMIGRTAAAKIHAAMPAPRAVGVIR